MLSYQLDKKYQRYGRDVLSALIDNPTFKGNAAGSYMPYLRFEMEFPAAVEVPQVAAKYTDMVRGKISAEQLFKGNEIHDMAYAIGHAVEAAINDGSQKFTVEAVVQPSRQGTGTSVHYFIYSESHRTPQELHSYLDENRQSIMARFATVCSDGTNLGAA